MIITPESISYINVYLVDSYRTLYAGIDSGISSSKTYVLATDIEQAMEIVRGFYNRDDIGDLTFRSVEYIGKAKYVLGFLTAKETLREAKKQS